MKLGIDNKTKSSNIVNYDKGGYHKVTLTEVKSEQIGKDDGEKWDVLTFKFMDADGIRQFRKSYFPLKETDPKYNNKLEALNVAIKHIYEAYATAPQTGIGVGATTFKQFFDMVADAFNKNGINGTPIYKDDKGVSYLMWVKLVFFQNKIDLPYSPNFIERIGKDKNNQKVDNITQPKTLTINLNYDQVDQIKPQSAGAMGGSGGINTGSSAGDDF